MIEAKGVTLKYPNSKGIFDVTFEVKKGKVTGYLGPNGAGKTTTIRTLMGFMKPDAGSCSIGGLDCFEDAAAVKRRLGYIPGEIAFPGGMTCREFLRFQCKLRAVSDLTRMNALMERFELSQNGAIRRFSKGMKQKIGIVTAFLHDPEVLILDEPTSGLDPLMQNEFISLILEEKKRGKTILMSSHMFEEVERTCDDVLIIRDGRLVASSDVSTLKASRRKCYLVRTPQPDRLKAFGFETGAVSEAGVEVYIKGEETDALIKKLSTIQVTGLDIRSQSLEDIFLNFYGPQP